MIVSIALGGIVGTLARYLLQGALHIWTRWSGAGSSRSSARVWFSIGRRTCGTANASFTGSRDSSPS